MFISKKYWVRYIEELLLFFKFLFMIFKELQRQSQKVSALNYVGGKCITDRQTSQRTDR